MLTACQSACSGALGRRAVCPLQHRVTPAIQHQKQRSTPIVAARGSSSPSNTAVAASNSTGNPWAQPGYLDAVVSRMPEEQQKTVFLGILAAIGAGTALSCTVLGPAISSVLPSFLQVTGKSWFPLGPIFLAAGIAHFTGEWVGDRVGQTRRVVCIWQVASITTACTVGWARRVSGCIVTMLPSEAALSQCSPQNTHTHAHSCANGAKVHPVYRL